MVVRVRRAARAVARLDVEAQLVAFLEHHGRRPDLDLALDGLVGLEPPALVVRVVRAVRQRLLRVELAVRRAQPALW